MYGTAGRQLKCPAKGFINGLPGRPPVFQNKPGTMPYGGEIFAVAMQSGAKEG